MKKIMIIDGWPRKNMNTAAMIEAMLFILIFNL